MMRVALLVLCLLMPSSLWAATIFNDGFEGGTDGGACNSGTGWDTETDTGGDMVIDDNDTITPHEGTKVCKNVMNDTTVAYVAEDTAFASETEVYLRFYLLIEDGGTYPDGQGVFIIEGRNEADNDQEMLIFLRKGSTLSWWHIDGRIELDDGTQVDTNNSHYGLVANRWYCVQAHWKAATGVGNNDGLLEMWVDGRSIGTATGVDNDTGNFGDIEFGDQGTDATPAMTLYLDDFASDDATMPACTGITPRAQPSVGMWRQQF